MALQGIPISQEQCIGDSLYTINASFTALDSRTTELSSNLLLSAVSLVEKITSLFAGDDVFTTKLNLTASELTSSLTLTASTLSTSLALSASNLQTAILEMSGTYTVANQTTFQFNPSHNNTTIVLTGTDNVKISKDASATFKPNHRTTILQLGTGRGYFEDPAFKVSSFQTLSTGGQYTTCEIRNINADDVNMPWVVVGQLSASLPPLPDLPEIFQFSLKGSYDQNSAEAIEIAGGEDDVFYFNSRPMDKSNTEVMTLVVNGSKRMTVAFTSDRLRTYFGYKPKGTATISTALLSGGNVPLTINDPAIISIPVTTEELQPTAGGLYQYSLTGDREDTVAGRDISLRTFGKADVLYYNSTAPALSSDRLITVNVFVNGVWRSTITAKSNRLGSTFGYKLASAANALATDPTGTIVHGTFIVDSPYLGSYSSVNLTGASWTPLPAPTLTLLSNSLTGPTEETNTLTKSVSSYGFPDTIYFADRLNTTSTPLSTMSVVVNGNDRLSVRFSYDRVTTDFQYKMQGYSDVLTGKFGAGKVHLTSGTHPLALAVPYNPFTNKLSVGGNDTSNGLVFSDPTIPVTGYVAGFCFYNNNPAPSTVGNSTATLFMSGDTTNSIGTIVFKNGLLNTDFGFSFAGNPDAPQMLGKFVDGNVVLSLILTGNQTDSSLNGISMLNYTNSARLFYGKRLTTTSPYGITSQIYVNSKYVATITYYQDYVGQPFGFSPYNTSVPLYNGTFASNKILL